MSGSTYIPDPNDATQPTGTQFARTVAAEFRALKAKINNLTSLVPTWNPVDKGVGLFLSNGDLVVLKNLSDGLQDLVRCTVGKSGPDFWYYETQIGLVTGDTRIGLAVLGESTQAALGSSINSIGYSADGKYWYNNASTPFGTGFVAGDIVSIIFSVDYIVVRVNNVLVVAIINPWNAALATVAKYPAVSLANFGDYVTSNFGATSFVYTPPAPAMGLYTPQTYITGPQNLISNADFFVDQRNARAVQAAIASGSYMSDRWRYSATSAGQYNAQNFLGTAADVLTTSCLAYQRMTVQAGFAVGAADALYFAQRIKGNVIAKLGFGTAGAKATTLLFWVRSSLTGLFSGAITDSAGTRSFPFLYTVTAANTWQRVAVQLPGCITGAWIITAASGAEIRFNLGSGANFLGVYNGTWQNASYTGAVTSISPVVTAGATVDITGVEWKQGLYPVSSAPEAINQAEQLLDCQSYYGKYLISNAGYTNAAVGLTQVIYLPTKMRAAPALVTSAHANTNCSNSTGGNIDTQTIAALSVGVALGGFVQVCTITADAEL